MWTTAQCCTSRMWPQVAANPAPSVTFQPHHLADIPSECNKNHEWIHYIKTHLRMTIEKAGDIKSNFSKKKKQINGTLKLYFGLFSVYRWGAKFSVGDHWSYNSSLWLCGLWFGLRFWWMLFGIWSTGAPWCWIHVTIPCRLKATQGHCKDESTWWLGTFRYYDSHFEVYNVGTSK